MYANKEDALNNRNVLDTQKTNEKGFATFKQLPPYYGACIKESETIENYQIRNKEKDIISVYRDNGVRFLGEIEPDKMRVTSINQDGKEKTIDLSKNINQELQNLTSAGINFNDNTNWLVFNDNGTEKLVSKKPLKHSIAWNSLYNAGVVFEQKGIDDLINANFYTLYYGLSPSLKDFVRGKGTPKTYKPTYITINDKRYIIRLMRGYNEKIGFNDDDRNWGSTFIKNATKGSEWNRLIPFLIDPTGDDNDTGYDNGTNGRYGSDTKKFVENNMPILANYSWWTDFGGNSNDSGNYDKGNKYGVYRRAQETGNRDQNRVFLGADLSTLGASFFNRWDPNKNSYEWGWLPVLELVD